MKKSINSETLDTTSKTKGELAKEYGVSGRTFASWLRDHQIDTGRRKLLTSKEIGMVYNRIGVPREDVPIRRLVR